MIGWEMRHDAENGTYFVSPPDKLERIGFSRDDVGILRTMASELTHAAEDYPEVAAAYPSDFAARMTSIADRIEKIIGFA